MEEEIQKQKKQNEKLLKRLIVMTSILMVLVVIVMVEYRMIKMTEDIVRKPILYLYPEEESVIEVKFIKPEKLTCTYPKYEQAWQVTAKPDGSLIDNKTGRSLYALYWEGNGKIETNGKEGFVVKGSETIPFLEEKLKILGLNEREANEFIIYWLPELQKNNYNYIRFAELEEINQEMPIEISPKPDTLIRVLMQYKGLDELIEVKEQKLKYSERKGYVAIEWGGTEIKNN